MKELRDFPSSLLMIISIVTSTIVILNAICLTVMISKETDIKKSYNNIHHCAINGEIGFVENGYAAGVYGDILEHLSGIGDSNIIWTGAFLSVGNNYMTSPVDLYLTVNETIKQTTKKGIYFSKEGKETEAIIGEGLTSQTYEKDGKLWIDVLNEPCRVIDYFENNTAGGCDTRIIVDYCYGTSSFKESVLKNISNPMTYYDTTNTFYIDICSDSDIEAVENEVADIVGKNNMKLEEQKEDSNNAASGINQFFVLIKKSVLWISLFFAVCSFICATLLFVKVRMRQWVIRRVFGYSLMDIAKSVVPEMFVITLMGTMIGLLLFAIQNIFNHYAFTVIKDDILIFIAGYLGIAAMIIVVVFIFSIYALHRNSLIDNLRGRSE